MSSFSLWHWLIVLVFLGFLVIQLLYILCIQRAFHAIDLECRPVAPGLAWLLLIPVFNIVWIFFLVVWMSRGLDRMWENQRLSKRTSGGFGVGLGFGISLALCAVPGVNLVAWIPALVFWILHWWQVAEVRTLVLASKV